MKQGFDPVPASGFERTRMSRRLNTEETQPAFGRNQKSDGEILQTDANLEEKKLSHEEHKDHKDCKVQVAIKVSLLSPCKLCALCVLCGKKLFRDLSLPFLVWRYPLLNCLVSQSDCSFFCPAFSVSFFRPCVFV